MLKKFSKLLVVAVLLMVLVTSSALAMWVLESEIRVDGSKSYRGMALSNDEKIIYVVGLQDEVVLAYDLTADKPSVLYFAPMPDASARAKAIFVSDDGHVWVPSTQTRQVFEFSPSLEVIAIHDVAWVGVTTCEGILVGSDGSLYLSERDGLDGLVKAIKTDSGWQRDTSWGEDGAANLDGDVRIGGFASDGTIYIGTFSSKSNPNTIFKINEKGEKSVFATTIANSFQVAVDNAGNVYNLSYSQEPILSIINPEGEVIDAYGKKDLGLITEAAGMALSKDGKKLYVLDQQAIAIKVYAWQD